MKRITFLDKTKELAESKQASDTITLFEISQHYGSSLTSLLIFILTLPFLIFSTMWVCLPLSFIIIVLSGWFFFDQPLWMPDPLKNLHIGKKALQSTSKAIALSVEKLQGWITKAGFYQEYDYIFRKISAVVLIAAAFQLGFIQSPATSYFTIFSLILISLDLLTDIGYLTFVGYLLFLIGLI